MPTTNHAVVKPKRPYPLAAVTMDKRPPAAVGKIDARNGKLGAHAVEMNERPRGVARDFSLGDQAGDSHRRKSSMNRRGDGDGNDMRSKINRETKT